jgi:hypothetical protein
LAAEDWEGCSDAVEHAFEVDVDHQVPLFDVQIVEGETASRPHC